MAGWLGVQMSASRAQLVLTTFGTTTSSGYASAACAASSACAVLPRPGSSASRNVRCPSAAAATSRAWCGISWRPNGARTADVVSGRAMQDDAVRGVLERREQRADEVPAGEPARPHGAGGAREVGDEEGVGQAAGHDRRRHHRALRGGGERRDDGVGRGLRLGLGLDAGGGQHLALEVGSGLGDPGVLGQQHQQRGVAGGGLGQDGGDAVEALELLGALRLGAGGVGLDPGPLLADQQPDDLELGAHRGRTLPRSTPASTSRTARASTGMMPSLSRSRTRRRDRGAVRVAPDWRWPRRANKLSSGLPRLAAGAGRNAVRGRRPGGRGASGPGARWSSRDGPPGPESLSPPEETALRLGAQRRGASPSGEVGPCAAGRAGCPATHVWAYVVGGLAASITHPARAARDAVSPSQPNPWRVRPVGVSRGSRTVRLPPSSSTRRRTCRTAARTSGRSPDPAAAVGAAGANFGDERLYSGRRVGCD